MDITIIRNNRLDRSKFIVSHVTCEKERKIADILLELGIEKENVVIFIGKHYQVLNDEVIE